jgi:hypothetical protein
MKKFLLSIMALAVVATASAQFAANPEKINLKKGEKIDVIFSLKTDAAPVAFQIYFKCPEGIDVDQYENDDEEMVPSIVKEGTRYKSHHTLTVKPVVGEPRTYFAACASSNGSADNATLKNVDGKSEGDVIKVTFVCTADDASGDILLYNMLAGAVGGAKTNFDDAKIAVNGETAINGISAEQTKSGVIYNMAGQRVSKATKGIYVIDGKKVAVSK